MHRARWTDAGLAVAGALLATVIVLQATSTARRPALEKSAAAALAEDRPHAAERAALGVLVRDPLDLTALQTLALARGRLGDRAGAEAIFDFVTRRSRREGVADAYMLHARLAQGRFDEALDHADNLLRRDDDGRWEAAVFPVLVAAASYDRPRAALVQRLTARPPWRTAFLSALGSGPDPASAIALMTDLRDLGSGPSAAERAPLVDRLAAEGRYGEALSAWEALAPTRERGVLGRDGDFTGPPDPSVFGWSQARGAGVESDVRPGPAGAGLALRIAWDGFSGADLPRQLLVLSPGRYRLAWRAFDESGRAGAMTWTVRCATDGRRLTPSPRPTSPGANAPGWASAAVDFAVPPAACAGQWLQLTAQGGERRSETVAWYRGLRIARSDPPR